MMITGEPYTPQTSLLSVKTDQQLAASNVAKSLPHANFADDGVKVGILRRTGGGEHPSSWS